MSRQYGLKCDLCGARTRTRTPTDMPIDWAALTGSDGRTILHYCPSCTVTVRDLRAHVAERERRGGGGGHAR